VGIEPYVADASGQKRHLTTDKWLGGRITFHADSSVQHCEHVKTLVTSYGLLVRETPTIQYELVGGDQSIEVGRAGRLGRLCSNRTAVEINHT
jgi:hypothetical protein